MRFTFAQPTSIAMKPTASIILTCLVVACSKEQPTKPVDRLGDPPLPTTTAPITEANRAETLSIREATFRYQFQKNASGQQQKAGAYFLSLGRDSKPEYPDEDFLRRFVDVQPPVKSAAQCESSAEKGVRDKQTGVQGLIFYVGEIKWISDTEVEVSGGYYEAGLSASGNTYYLKKKDGKWVVERDQMHWIS